MRIDRVILSISLMAFAVGCQSMPAVKHPSGITVPMPGADSRAGVRSQELPDIRGGSAEKTAQPGHDPVKAQRPFSSQIEPRSEARVSASGAPQSQQLLKILPDGRVMIPHIRFKDAGVEKKFMAAMAQKKTLEDEVKVVNGLVEKKNAEAEKLSQSLADSFAINPAIGYTYDAPSMTIYELVSPADGGGAGLGKEQDKRVHRVLKERDQERQFLKILTSKKIALNQIESLQLIIKEKQQEIAGIDDELSKDFSIAKGPDYRYEADTKILYEIVRPADGVEVVDQYGNAVGFKK
jgi:hypothetical protein